MANLSLREACRLVAQGAVIIYPTETVWGIGGRADSREVVERILSIKRIAAGRPFPVLVASRNQGLTTAATGISGFRRLTREFWPGPLTLVVPMADPDGCVCAARDGTVGLRLSALPEACSLARSAGGLLVSTSANRTGQEAPASAQDVSQELRSSADGVLDSEARGAGAASTLLAYLDGRWKLIREGAVPRQRIREVVRLS